MTRRAARVDNTQPVIVRALRDCGWTVQDLSRQGHGCPDIIVGAAGVNVFLELKSARGHLTPDQVEWHAEWRGQVAVARTADEAVAIVSAAIRERAA